MFGDTIAILGWILKYAIPGYGMDTLYGHNHPTGAWMGDETRRVGGGAGTGILTGRTGQTGRVIPVEE